MSSNNFGVQDKDTSDSPNSRLDVISEAVETNADDSILEGLGLGNYTEKEHWQQVQSFRDGMFANAAFANRIVARAVQETIIHLGTTGHSYYDDDQEDVIQTEGWQDLDEAKKAELFDEDGVTRRDFIVSTGEEIWEDLTEEQRVEAVEDVTGSQPGWTPPFWRMMDARHETSRSRDARLMDNLFGTRNVEKLEGDMEAARQMLGGEQ